MNEPSSVLKSDKLLIAIREKNETQAMKTVEDQIKNGLPHMLDDPLMEWKFYLVGLLTYITYFLNDSGVVENYYDHSRVEFTKEVYNAQSVEQCEEILRKIARFFSEREQEPERTLSPLVRKVITDVDTDLKEPLTLQYFSEKLGVNGSYLSNLFRRETGKSPKGSRFWYSRKKRTAPESLRCRRRQKLPRTELIRIIKQRFGRDRAKSL